jgi:tetratricopeptide (TPR) repeat protein
MFEKAVEMSPEDETNAGNLADGYRLAGNTAKAQATYDKAIALAYKELRVNPRDASVTGRMALYYAKNGDVQQGKDFVRRARAIDGSDAYLIYVSAIVKTIANEPADAVKDLGLALQKGFSVKDASVEPEFAPLLARPDFQALVKKYEGKAK